MKKSFTVEGMTCSACVAHVEKAVKKIKGVDNCAVNLLTKTLRVDGVADDAEIIKAVESVGYKVVGADGMVSKKNKRGRVNPYIIRLIVSFAFMIPLMYVAMSHMLSLPLPSFLHGNENAITFAMVQLLLTLPVMLVNKDYFVSGYKKLFKLVPNMDTLIAIGSSAAFAYGIFAIIMIGYGLGHGDMAMVEKYSMDMYFESAAMILTLITLGKFFEDKAKDRTKDALTRLTALQPSSVTVQREGREMTVTPEQVVKGDLVVVRAGDRLPVDGVVCEGIGVIDQSAVTGESMPITADVGDNVISGSVCVDSRFVYEAVSVGSETTISRIIELMENAQATKAPIQKLADKVAGIFVPIVISIALLTFIVWLAVGQAFNFALALGIAVLVISCPCALGLATPLAIMVGTGLGAERGILYKSAESIELLGKVDTVVFDKTGTITTGKPTVIEEVINDGCDRAELLQIMDALERGSNHPLAKAVHEYVDRQNLHDAPDADGYETIVGKGVSATVRGKRYYCGNAVLMRENGIDMGGIEGSVGIKMYLSDDKRVLMLLVLEDEIKESAVRAIAELNKRKITTIILTGDNRAAAEAVGAKVGVSRVISDVLPDGKDEVIRQLKENGARVAMVGDGINDSIALVRADVGFAVAHGSDVAIDSADIVLMKSEPYDVVEAVDISRKTIRTIKLNLFWAFAYNSLGIPLAAGVLYPFFELTLSPMIAALAMSLSSLFVVSNTLLMKVLNMKKRGKMSKRVDEKTCECDSGVYAESGGICPVSSLSENDVDDMIADKKAETDDNETNNNIEEANINMEIQVKGMMCGHCKLHVEKALKKIGLDDAVADYESGRVTFTDRGISMEDIRAAIQDAGYEVE